ncbi:MAG: hypothetical protein Q8O41_09405 [Candidatus Methanoperedens sp.]|nr:hypothetical protein [Candidatus Methanoperedens sp.]
MEKIPASSLPSGKDVLREQFPGHAAVLDRIEKLRIRKQADSLA